ncbi:MAG: response regulator transcription factor [Chloroflexota bacterium]|nr:response regulator transcription factor [Chloroflexota bacterium]
MAQTEAKAVRLYVAEEQEIYRELFRHIFITAPEIDLTGVSAHGDPSALHRELASLRPDVLLMGIRRLDGPTLDGLRQLCEYFPAMGVILLLSAHDGRRSRQLRELMAGFEGGLALFLKHSIDHVEQLSGIVLAVGGGQVIIDPVLIASLLMKRSEFPILKRLTSRELEILGLVSLGYTNAAIGEALCIDVRTVENHINSMYGKLKTETDVARKHLRVTAARLYLEAEGQLRSAAKP